MEGFEYPIVNNILEEGYANLIDEMFVEVHYKDPGMSNCKYW